MFYFPCRLQEARHVLNCYEAVLSLRRDCGNRLIHQRKIETALVIYDQIHIRHVLVVPKAFFRIGQTILSARPRKAGHQEKVLSEMISSLAAARVKKSSVIDPLFTSAPYLFLK